jgi:hypothetical protein
MTTRPTTLTQFTRAQIEKALYPLMRWGDLVDETQWAALSNYSTPQAWAKSIDTRMTTGLDRGEMETLTAALQMVLDGAKCMQATWESTTTLTKVQAVVGDMQSCSEATRDVLTWLAVDAEHQRISASEPEVYAMARALAPFVDMDNWEEQHAQGQDIDAPGTWVCRAGLDAKVYAEAIYARWVGDGPSGTRVLVIDDDLASRLVRMGHSNIVDRLEETIESATRNEPTMAQLRIKVGDRILIAQDDGSPVYSTCRVAPNRLSSGDWVLSYEGRTGGYLLTRCWPLPKDLAAELQMPELVATLTVHEVGAVVVNGDIMECAVLVGDLDALQAVAGHLYSDVQLRGGV